MIEYLKKDITTVDAGVVAHGVNCQGAMGSGVAGALRRKYPKIFLRYKNICDLYVKTPDWMLGIVDFVDIDGVEGEPALIVANCFTQENYGRDSKRYASVDAVKRSIDTAVQTAIAAGLPFYMPKIGCGLGGLSWENEVEPIVREISDTYSITIYVCDL